ncbi:hypothetical protein TNIN_27701 [Trichonephila inaurata madagascariensis]|uniref:Uncharacterized protein n=1 Tax=Trichonephila inaurata madagascariensis TaxID=2747483 RepID=A0A8X6YGT6_9ARAC|nr:hypothetical protein TNIN_27701 [Trichonephila inaurata madagascariensis]
MSWIRCHFWALDEFSQGLLVLLVRQTEFSLSSCPEAIKDNVPHHRLEASFEIRGIPTTSLLGFAFSFSNRITRFSSEVSPFCSFFSQGRRKITEKKNLLFTIAKIGGSYKPQY